MRTLRKYTAIKNPYESKFRDVFAVKTKGPRIWIFADKTDINIFIRGHIDVDGLSRIYEISCADESRPCRFWLCTYTWQLFWAGDYMVVDTIE